MILFFLILCLFCTVISSANVELLRNSVEIILNDGYVGERHQVSTPDGYIVEMHRIPFSRYQTNSDVRRPPVFVQHGILSSSEGFIEMGPEYSIAYNLADAGFDVWLGNARGNKYSRAHLTVDPDQQSREFFDFSFDEIGFYDLSTMIDFVLNYTDNEKVHYIGHSQGGTAFLVLNSLRPKFNEKFSSVHLLAGVGYQDYFPEPTMRMMATHTNTIYEAALRIGFVEIGANIFTEVGDTSNCNFPESLTFLCNVVEVIKYIVNAVGGMTDGAAVKQVAQYGQNIRDKVFRRFDHGVERNLEVYGSIKPPIYNISLITTRVVMHYTVSDVLLDERDVLAMARDMPDTVVRKVAREDFGHTDFIKAEDVKELVTDYIITDMLSVENGETESESEEGGSSEENKPETGSSCSITLSFIATLLLIINSLNIILVKF